MDNVLILPVVLWIKIILWFLLTENLVVKQQLLYPRYITKIWKAIVIYIISPNPKKRGYRRYGRCDMIYRDTPTPRCSFKFHCSGTMRRCRRRRFQGVTTPKRIYISKKQLCSMEASSTKGAQFQLYLNICHRDFSITIYYLFGLLKL